MTERLIILRNAATLTALCAALTLPSAAQTSPFGLSLSPGVKALLTEVERAYGHPIIEQSIEDRQLLGSSHINDAGVPVVALSPTGRNEPTLAHELMHLVLRSEGYPEVEYLLPDGSTPTGIAARELSSAHLLIRDPIEHWIFAPRLNKLGLNPDEYNIDRMRAFLTDGQFRGLARATETSMRAVFYFEAMLVLDHDPNLLKQIRERYDANGWAKEREIGRSMAAVVLEKKPSSPEEEIACYVACSNIIFAGKVHFAVIRWDVRHHGLFGQRIVFIGASAPDSVGYTAH